MKVKGLNVNTGQVMVAEVESDKISSISYGSENPLESLPYLAPGLVDLQVNGVGGVDFNVPFVTHEDVMRITHTLLDEGVTSYFPTVITNSDEAIEKQLSQIAASRARDAICEACIPGIHLEGPFISPEDGPRGAHSREHVMGPDWERFERWQSAAKGSIKIVTLAPEWPEAMEFIRRCVETGVTVAIGHTAASPLCVREAVAAGARLSTHLGNGSSPLIHRHQSYLWEQLANDDLYASLIPDGFHLPSSFLKVALRAKGHRAVLVSDAVALCGMPPGEYGTEVGGKVVLRKDGKLHLADHPEILAGSVRLLPFGIAHLVRSGLATLAEAWDMASTRPARLLKLPVQEGLSVGARADITMFRWDGTSIQIDQVIKAGIVIRDR